VQVPFQLTFRGMAHSDALAAHVRLRVEKLEHLFDRIVSCHVVVELAGHHHRHGDHFHVSINLGLSGHEILVGHAPSDVQWLETAYGAVDRAFDDAGRELKGWLKHQRTQRHDQAAKGRTPGRRSSLYLRATSTSSLPPSTSSSTVMPRLRSTPARTRRKLASPSANSTRGGFNASIDGRKDARGSRLRSPRILRGPRARTSRRGPSRADLLT